MNSSPNNGNEKKKTPDLTSPLTGEEIKTLWFVHTMKYYTVVKMNKLQLHATT